MVYYIGTDCICFSYTHKLEFYLYGHSIFGCYLTIYQQHRNFKVLIYIGVLLIQIRFIRVLTCFIVKLIRWLNFTHKKHTFNANGRLWENLYTVVSLLLSSIYK